MRVSAQWLANEWVLLGLILLAAVALRVWYLCEIVHAPDFAAPVLDPQLNDYWARALVTGDWTPPDHAEDPRIRSTPYGRPPGYPYVLALIYWLSGDGYLAPRVVQMAFGLLNVVLLFLLGHAVYGRPVGLVAAAFMSVYWPFIYFEGELNSPVFVVLLALLLVHAFRRWADRATAWACFAGGLTLGLFALFRPNVLLVGPAVLVWLAWVARRRKMALRQWSAAAVVFCAGVMVAISPALIRNYVVARDFVLISYYGGVNAYVGNNEQASGTSAEIPDIQAISGLDGWNCFSYPTLVRNLGKKLGDDNMTFSRASRYFYGRAVDFVVHHPLKAVRLTGKKALLFWGTKEVSDSKVVQYERAYWPPLGYLPGFPLALALFVVGVVLFVGDVHSEGKIVSQRGLEAAGLIFVYIGAYFVSVLPFFISGRYRVPVIPFLLLFGAYGCCRVVRFALDKDIAKAGLSLGLFAGACVLSHLELVPYTPDLSKWHFHRAVAYSSAGKTGEAVDELRKALEVDSRNVEAHLRIGFELARQGGFDEALAHYREAVEVKPNHALAHNNLGYELARRGNPEQAAKHYQTALRLNPYLALARNNLGNLLVDQGKPDEAMAQFNAALATDPDDRYAHYNLANVLAGQGKADNAERQYLLALENNREDPSIPNNLGLLLAQQKRYDEAIRWLREALRRDPNYARAHFNLGNVFGELGRLDAAIEHLEKALELNPSFTEAQENLRVVIEAKQENLPTQAGGVER